MAGRDRALGARLSLLHAASFIGYAFYLPFFPVFLQSKGLGPTAIGTVVAISIVVRILVTAPLLSLADRAFGPRRLLIASHLGQAVGFPALALIDDPVSIAMTVALISVAQAAVIPTNDLVTTTALRQQQGLHYGRIRSLGSIAFLLTSILAGYLLAWLGPSVVLVAQTLGPLGAILATWLAVPVSLPRDRPVDSSAAARPALPPTLLLLMLAAAAIQASHGGLYAFASIHWRQLGFSDATIGYFWAVGVLAEIFIFALLGRGVGRGAAGFGLLFAGGAAAVVRFSVLAADPGLAVTFAAQALHGLTFGATHLGAMAALAALAPEAVRGRAQGLLGSIAALAMAATTALSGFIDRAAGGAAVFAAMAPLGAVGIALALFAFVRSRAQPQSSGDGG
jgi:PPP family 3-phenylpropionic acid transporter